MDSSRGPAQITSSDADQSFSRTVSFPNFLRSIWYHHHFDETAGHFHLDESKPELTNLPETPPPSVANSTQSLQVTTSDTQNLQVSNSDTQSLKLTRSDTWAGFAFMHKFPGETSQQTDTSSSSASEVSDQKNIAPSSSCSSVDPAASAADTAGHLTVHTPQQVYSSSHHSKILTAFMHHDVARVLATDRPDGDGKVSGTEMNSQTLCDHSGLFGLPRRVKVTKREMNMMTPISF